MDVERYLRRSLTIEERSFFNTRNLNGLQSRLVDVLASDGVNVGRQSDSEMWKLMRIKYLEHVDDPQRGPIRLRDLNDAVLEDARRIVTTNVRAERAFRAAQESAPDLMQTPVSSRRDRSVEFK